MKKLLLFVLVLLAVMAAAAFLVVTWLRASARVSPSSSTRPACPGCRR